MFLHEALQVLGYVQESNVSMLPSSQAVSEAQATSQVLKTRVASPHAVMVATLDLTPFLTPHTCQEISRGAR